jgi:hypothetical protein
MRALNSVLATFLVLLWMPVTVHCGLEEAGILELSAETCCDEKETCAKDSCAVVEDGGYTLTVSQPKVPAPGLLASSCFLYAQTIHLAEESMAAAWSETMDASLDWVSDWHFVRRAAFPARAPSLNA